MPRIWGQGLCHGFGDRTRLCTGFGDTPIKVHRQTLLRWEGTEQDRTGVAVPAVSLAVSPASPAPRRW